MSFSLIVHGGAGKGSTDLLKKAQKKTGMESLGKKYHDSLKECVEIGKKILKNNGTAADAVVECTKYLEDNELYNAGKGAVFDKDGMISLDACIMLGDKNKRWGAIGCTNIIKNPIELCRKMMNRSKNNMFIVGNGGCEKMAHKYNANIVKPSYFESNYRKKISSLSNDLGTVGVVALDKKGNICSGTSTGGTSKKEAGRVGDTLLIGISTIADNDYLGVSCTGKGEEIIRNHCASQVLFRSKFNGQTLKEAIDATVESTTGSCGIIGIDKLGDVYFRMNTERMYIGYVKGDEEIKTHLFTPFNE